MGKFAPELAGYRERSLVDIKEIDEKMKDIKARRASSEVVPVRGGVVRRRSLKEGVEVVGDGEREFTVYEGGKNTSAEEAVKEPVGLVEITDPKVNATFTREEDAALLARARRALKIENPESMRHGSAGQGGGNPGRPSRKR